MTLYSLFSIYSETEKKLYSIKKHKIIELHFRRDLFKHVHVNIDLCNEVLAQIVVQSHPLDNQHLYKYQIFIQTFSQCFTHI